MNESNDQQWIIYGAYGYTGKLIVSEALAQGRKPILAGRSESQLKPMAKQYDLEYRVFNAEDAGKHLQGVDVMINCAGPFVVTATPIMDACIECGLHYFDITGEMVVFEAAHQRHERARQAGVILCPGVGFDIVPSDMIAALLKQAIPDATHLSLAFDFGTVPSLGTARTGVQTIGDGGIISVNGKIENVGHGYKMRQIPFPISPSWGTSVPWGDVFTAYISTGIPNTIVYIALPRVVCWSFAWINPIRHFLARPTMQKMLMWLAEKFLDEGPSEQERAEHHTRFWGEVTAADGRTCSATLTAPSTYMMTAELSVAIPLAVESWDGEGGYYTASMLLGAEFLSTRPGYNVVVSAVADSSGSN